MQVSSSPACKPLHPQVGLKLNTARGICRAATKEAAKPADACIELLRRGAKTPGEIPAHTLLKSIVELEKAKLPADPSWQSTLAAPGTRWRLIYTAGSKDVQTASKGDRGKAGQFFPLNAVQKFEDGIFENGVFLGPVASLTFKGPFTMSGKRLTFDVDTMCIGLGPFRLPIPLKESQPIEQRDPKEQKGLPFFLYAYLDEDIVGEWQ
ncbi:hypothetical protein DUNSADRAFT_816 [Dunaliella salina]|uniref:Plastid lipid-associated protein/fibrillin conserved domain-containing protein n=1 Tax=Dunaliella salina TaxID=3046 RepID=A0ABQ7GXS6_DUNSA|nr:hypothetical protein DUNSADRAFT_816 [Dunaliella salina]|eukprot:KAF5839414.1 hypothetical protein DUNSADRAFT_816 [Dunaliella salina]